MSDKGTNFVGANSELKHCLRLWNQEQIHDDLLRKGIQWKFNPPLAPHFDGVWERMVLSTETILRQILGKQCVNSDTLNTLLAEVESILNSRPLTSVSDSPDDFEAITPNHFLIGRANPNIPSGVFFDPDICSRKRWRQAQVQANHFWRRFTKEYLPWITLRSKWNQERNSLKHNDMVLIVEENKTRGSWFLGRIIKSIPGPDDRIRTADVKTKNRCFETTCLNALPLGRGTLSEYFN